MTKISRQLLLTTSIGVALAVTTTAHAQAAPAAPDAGEQVAPNALSAPDQQGPSAAVNRRREAETAQTGEIIVTARRVGERIQQAPLAISALNTRDMQTKAVQDVNDLGKVVPSLTTLQQATGAAGLFIQLRGLIQTDTAAFQAGSVGTYQDDVYIGGAMIAGQLLNIADLERVEVLKGPQGTLYGRNVTGGVLKFVTQKPSTEKVEGYAKAGYGAYDRKLLEGMINLPVSDNAALRLNGQYEDRDGFSRDIVNKRDLENLNRWTVRGAFSADLSPKFHVLFQGSYGQYRGNGADDRTTYVDPTNFSGLSNFIVAQRINGLTASNLAPLVFGAAGGFTPAQIGAAGAAYGAAVPTALGLIDTYSNASRDNARQYTGFQTSDRARLGLGALTLAYDISDDITLKSVSAYTDARRRSFYTVGGDAYTYIYSGQTGEVSQWTQEFQAVGKAFGGKLTFAAGLFLLDQNIKDNRDPAGVDGIFPFSLGQRGLGLLAPTRALNNIGVKSLAPYGQASYEILPKVHVTGGLRYTTEKFSIKEGNFSQGGAVCDGPAPTTAATPVGDCFVSASSKFNNLSYTVGADWTVAPDVLLYVRSGRGFKSGGVNPFISGGQALAPFAPEENTDYEIGLKSEFLDRRIRFNTAYFHTNYNDIQRTVTKRPANGVPITQVENAASAKIDGVETEINIRPVGGFDLGGTYTWTHARYKDYSVINSSFPGGVQNLSNTPFFTLPEHQYTLYANYGQSVSWGGYRAGVNWSHRSSTFVGQIDFPPTPTSPVAPRDALRQKGFGLLNGSLAFDISKYNLTITFWGKNVLNKRYKESGTCLVSLGLGSCWAAYGAPSTYGGDVTIRF